MQYSKQYACEQAVRCNMKKTYWSIMHRVALIEGHWVKQLSFASTREWTQLSEKQHTYNCYDNTHTIFTRLLSWASEGFFPGGAKSGKICFFPLKTKKTTFFAVIFKIQGTLCPPSSDALGCDISALYNNQDRPWKCDSNGIGWDSGLETCTHVNNFTSCSRNFLQLINILICAHSTVSHVEAQCRGVCEAKAQKQGRS